MANEIIKCISLWQPHASLVAFGEKPFETRHWPTKYRGLLAIHATKECSLLKQRLSPEFNRAFFEVSEKHGWGEWYWPQAEALDGAARNALPGRHCVGLGAILCVCEVAACVPTESPLLTDLLTDRIFPHWHIFGDFSAHRYAWRLRNVRRFREPIPLKGRQGLFNWQAPDDWELLLLPDVIHV